MLRRVIQNVRRLLNVQLAWLSVEAYAIPVEHPVGQVRCLLRFEDRDARTDRVNGTGREVDGVPRFTGILRRISPSVPSATRFSYSSRDVSRVHPRTSCAPGCAAKTYQHSVLPMGWCSTRCA